MATSGCTVMALISSLSFKQFVSHTRFMKVAHCIILETSCLYELFENEVEAEFDECSRI